MKTWKFLVNRTYWVPILRHLVLYLENENIKLVIFEYVHIKNECFNIQWPRLNK